jgi:CheY-like chemotaxis protein
MPKSLLVADDSLTIRKVIGMILSGEDVRVLSVDNGLEAVSKARELHPDLVLADVTMPGLSGYEVCEAIKSDPNTKGIPVLLLAGSFEPFDENRARAAQADGHLMKPFDSQALLTKVWELLGIGAEAVPTTSRSAQPIIAPPPGPAPRTPTAPAFPTPMRGLGVVPPAGPSAPGRAGGGMSMPPRPSTPVGPNPTWASTGGSPFAQAPARPASPLGPGGSQPASGSFPGQRAPQPGPAFGRSPAGQGGPGAPPRTPIGSTPAWAQNAPGAGRPAVPRNIPPTPAPGFGRPQGPAAGFAPPGAPNPQIRAVGPATGTQVFGRPSQLPQQAPPADGGEAALRRALASASREVIERIAWEVVPQIAEAVVREHLERLIKAREKGS